jgi:hypothetical protein
MCVGISITVVLGIILAFRFYKPAWVVALCLIAGIAIPLACLLSAVRVWNR